MAEIEKVAADRYRIRAHDHLLTVDAQDLLDLMDYGLRYATQLEQEAKQQPKPRQGECVECGRFSSLLSEQGYCEGCVMQAAIDAMEG